MTLQRHLDDHAPALPIVGTVGDDSLTGTAGRDVIIGLAGNDTLDGGADADRMTGGPGNDTYIVDNTGDTILGERPGSDIDTVLSSVSFRLPNFVENLTLTGSGSIAGIGNRGDNTIIGNSGDNIIDGGPGLDHLDGGAGNDTYIVHSAAEHPAAEFSDSGTLDLDTVRFAATAPGTLVLYAGDTGIERVVFGTGNGVTADTSGTTALSLDASQAPKGLVVNANDGDNTIIGTAFADYLLGANGNDSINGGAGNDTIVGGYGLDTLTGGAGADKFIFVFTPGPLNMLTITDFTSGVDKLELLQAFYPALSEASFTAAEFYSSASATEAHDADDRIIFNTTTGALYYDSDGSGGIDAVEIAVITGNVVYTDIAII